MSSPSSASCAWCSAWTGDAGPTGPGLRLCRWCANKLPERQPCVACAEHSVNKASLDGERCGVCIGEVTDLEGHER